MNSTLDVDKDELMFRLLKSKVTKCLRCESVHIRNKPRIRVILDVATLDKMFHTIQWRSFSTSELNNVRLKKINLENEYSINFLRINSV